MASVFSRINAPELLAGLAVGVGVGALLARSRSSSEAVRDGDAVKALEAKNSAAAKEAKARATAVEAERDQARREVEAIRAKKDAPKGAGDLEGLRRERDEMDALRKEAMRQVESLESQQLALRKRAEELASERDGAIAELEDAQGVVRSLEKEQASLQKEVDASKRKRKDSITKITRSLSDVSATLDSAETSWTPWNQINRVKEQLGTMQKDAVTEEDLVRGG